MGGGQPQKTKKTQNYHEIPFWDLLVSKSYCFFWVFWVLIGYFKDIFFKVIKVSEPGEISLKKCKKQVGLK